MARGDGVKKVSDLFAVYKKRLRAPQKSVIDCFVEVVEEVCGIALPKKSVRYVPSSRTISVTAPGQIKTEIALSKDELIVHMKGRLGEQSAPHHIV